MLARAIWPVKQPEQYPRCSLAAGVDAWLEREATLIHFDLEQKDGVTTVRLTHSGLASEQARERYQGWPWRLALLQGFVEEKASK